MLPELHRTEICFTIVVWILRHGLTVLLKLFFQDLFIMYVSTLSSLSVSSLSVGQKRASDPITDVCEPPCCCWKLNSGPPEEQAVLLMTEPSPSP